VAQRVRTQQRVKLRSVAHFGHNFAYATLGQGPRCPKNR
jgi:hypothetical protein